jgi:hypothetical protein
MSTAFGVSATASGTASTAFGWNAEASGNQSTASGYQTKADALDSTASGAYSIGGGNPINWVGSDPLFEIGNGTSSGSRSDALLVLKNGNTTIYGSDNELPNQTLVGSHSIMTEALADARYVQILSSGDVGIGNGSPTTLFEVGNGGSGKAAVDSDDASYGQMQIGNPNSNGSTALAFISGVNGFGDSPSSANGNGAVWAIGAAVWGNPGSMFGIGNEAYGGSILNLTSAGDVGIGTSNIWVDTGYTSMQMGGSTGSEIILGASGGGVSNRYLQLVGNSTEGVVETIQNIPMAFCTNGTERMRISNAGYVGIGTTSPVSPLDISTPGGGDTLTIQQTSAASGNNYANVTLKNSNGQIGNLAALGAGYSYSADFGSNDLALLAGQGYSSTNLVLLTNSSGSIKFATGGYATSNERMRITSVGNVGIGTTSPASTLDVNGKEYVRGSFVVTGTLAGSTVVASGTNLALIPQQGDLSMGTFTVGATPQ